MINNHAEQWHREAVVFYRRTTTIVSIIISVRLSYHELWLSKNENQDAALSSQINLNHCGNTITLTCAITAPATVSIQYYNIRLEYYYSIVTAALCLLYCYTDDILCSYAVLLWQQYSCCKPQAACNVSFIPAATEDTAHGVTPPTTSQRVQEYSNEEAPAMAFTGA